MLIPHGSAFLRSTAAERLGLHSPQPCTARDGPDEATGRDALALLGVPCQFDRDQFLFREGDPARWIYRVTSGALRTYVVLRDGRRSINRLYFRGDFVGLSERAIYSCWGQATTQTTVRRYRRNDLDDAVHTSRLTREVLVGYLHDEVRDTQEHLFTLGRRSSTERVAAFLLLLARRLGGRKAPLWRFFPPVTQSDVADYLGLTPETVSRTLTRLRTRGLLTRPERTEVMILRPDVLSDIAAGGAEPDSGIKPASGARTGGI